MSQEAQTGRHADIAGLTNEFWRDDETELASQFMRDGYVIQPTECHKSLDRIRDFVADTAASLLKQPPPQDKAHFLNTIHEIVSIDELNELRLGVIRAMNAASWVRPAYLRTARRALEIVVGNELAMQLRINASIQMPGDSSSVLPVHADVWSGDSPYEIVLWIPYVDVFRTKSMFILPSSKDHEHQQNMKASGLKSAEELLEMIRPDVKWLDIPYGHVLLFTQNVLHGNVLNEEETTRWSTNCRFKSVFSPYHDKKLGEFFEPVIVRPATRLGARYNLPSLT